jgi:tetratricopeptide (TPR) repeat protein
MNPNLSGDQFSYHPPKPRINPYRLMLWLGLILGAVWLLFQVQQGQVESPFAPTPTPTRAAESYVQEGQALYEAGKLDDPVGVDAIDAYQEATRLHPDNAALWAELARVQTYSSGLLSTDQSKLDRLDEALDSIDQALALNPDSSDAHAIRALVLDWMATNPLTPANEREALLTEARNEAVQALALDSRNTLGLVYYAEVLLDQQDWIQAQENIELALQLDPNSMDAHRVYAAVLESLGQYRRSIEEYEKAAQINPNLTFLYIRIGYTYRHLQVYDKALEYFAQAASINQQLDINDPTPYIGIAKTYTRQGEFFAAALNAERALEFDPTNADTYGQLGVIYVRSRNFEGALPVLQCAVEGCEARENEAGGVDVEGLPLSSSTLDYYLTYGSVLAALSRPGQNYCPRALAVLDEVETRFTDPTTLDVIQENRAICQLVGGEASSSP